VPRRSLTPLSSELGFEELHPARAGRVGRLRRRVRRERRAPTTRAGAIARGLLRLATWTAVASGLALLVNAFTNRGSAFGFYIVGGAILAIGFLTSAGGSRVYVPRHGHEREQRVSRSFAFVLAGAIVLAIGVLIEAL